MTTNFQARNIQNPAELFQAAIDMFPDIPRSLLWLVLGDGIFHPDNIDVPGAHSFYSVLSRTQKDVVVGVAGGTYLEHAVPKEQRLYYHLNRRLASLFVKQPLRDVQTGWSIATGQGPGKAMAGPLFCLKNAREAVGHEAQSCVSKCIGVPSGLKDEKPNIYADPDYTVRQQVETVLREMLLIILAKNGLIVYPGYKGSLFELALGMFINYCSGRSENGFLPFPIIIVDQPSQPDLGVTLLNDTYYGWLKKFGMDAERIGVSKNGSAGIHFVDVTWPNAAEIIVSHIRQGLTTYQHWPPTDDSE